MIVCLAELMLAACTAVNGPTNGAKLEVKSARIRQDNVVAVAQGNIGLNGDGKVEGNLRVDVTGYLWRTGGLAVSQSDRGNRALRDSP
jgi:hypothetical protein